MKKLSTVQKNLLKALLAGRKMETRIKILGTYTNWRVNEDVNDILGMIAKNPENVRWSDKI